MSMPPPNWSRPISLSPEAVGPTLDVHLNPTAGEAWIPYTDGRHYRKAVEVTDSTGRAVRVVWVEDGERREVWVWNQAFAPEA